MPDAKITALTAISVIDPAVDPLPIVDVSDTAMAASGTTKKITINQLLGASGTATLASATITGNLTVDTNTLFVDAANNIVGVGVVPSAGKGCLQLSSGINFPATQVASSDANTLDDYEEGNFTPTVEGTTTAGTATYSVQTGRYTKVGRLVTFSLRVIYTGGTGTGNLRVAGLPFSTGSSANYAIYPENIALNANGMAVASSSSGVSFITIDQVFTGGGAAGSVAYDAAGDMQISGSYIV